MLKLKLKLKYLASISPPSAVYACIKIMHRGKRTWMTKQKSKGPETDRLCWHAQTPRRPIAAAYGLVNWKGLHICFLLGTGRILHASEQYFFLILLGTKLLFLENQ